ncbi:MAG: hypothetical protein FWG34_02950, partial [Oscillospiraceae bacterium]|nr:hypothetical protein [Oscillospiraceae bacterium]
SWRQKLQTAIDSLIPYAKDFDELLKLMEAQGYKVKRGKYVSFCAPGQERFTRAKSIGEDYTEEAIKQKILTKPERQTTPPPTMPTFAPPVDKPETLKPKIDIAGNPIYATSRGLEQWAKLQNLKNTAAAFILMQQYGGLEAFNKLYADCRTDVDTITNGIQANNKRIEGLSYVCDVINTYHRTRPVYTQYRDMKKAKGNITIFGKDKAEEFRNQGNNNADIIDYENARRDLEDYERPLRKTSDMKAEIERIKTANVTNNKSLAIKKAELKKFAAVHSYLHFLQREHEPPPPPREQQQTRTKKRSNDIDL